MADVRFYHLTRHSLEQALPILLEKTLERGWRALVLTSSEDRAESLCQHLWTYQPDSFLPHGTPRDGHDAEQPVLLTWEDMRPNKADVLFQTDGAVSTRWEEYIRVCDLFDGGDPHAVAKARMLWKTAKTQGHTLSYWQEGERGGWKQQA